MGSTGLMVRLAIAKSRSGAHVQIMASALKRVAQTVKNAAGTITETVAEAPSAARDEIYAPSRWPDR